MQEGVDAFKKYLEEFARKYKKEINRNPDFRKDFHRMCVDIGVDPLACTAALHAPIDLCSKQRVLGRTSWSW